MINSSHFLVVRATVLAITFMCSCANRLDAQSFLSWVRNGSSSWNQSGLGVAVAPDGSVVAVGSFYYNMNLGSTNFYAYANNSHQDSLLVKYSANGDLIWVRADGGYSTESANAVAIDTSGNIYVIGSFSGTAYFGNTNISSFGGSGDVYLAKYSPAGDVLWVVQAGGGGYDAPRSVALDSQGNIVIVGSFYGTMYFGPASLTSAGDDDAFVAKYSPSGTLHWAVKIGGQSYDVAAGVAAGSSGECYIVGTFGGVVQHGATCTYSSGGSDAFVARIGVNGEVVWFRSGGGASQEAANGVAVAPNGEVWVTGYYFFPSAFGTTNLPNFGGQDIFVARYNGAGDLLRADGFGGTSDDAGNALAIDTNGNVYVAGQAASNPVSFPGTNVSGFGVADPICFRLDSAGNFKWAARAGGGNHDYGNAIAVDSKSHIYLTGKFGYNATFGNTNISTSSDSGFFLANYTRDLPVITIQPVSQSLTEGVLLALSLTVTGTGPFLIQWIFDGADIPDATNATLTVPVVSTTHAGGYTARVSNTEGTVQSDIATVEVATFANTLDTVGLIWTTGGNAPWFAQTNTTLDGSDALRSGYITNSQQSWVQTTVTGPARVTFAWKISSENGYDLLRFLINGVEVTNTSGKIEWKSVSFLLAPGVNTLRWAYSKDESESVGQDAGWLDVVNVIYAPAIETPPASLVVTSGVNMTFSAAVTGSAPLTYQWQFNGNNLPGATNLSLALSEVQTNQAGNYVLIVSNSAGTVVSAPASLVVLVPPTISGQPMSQSVVAGGGVNFTVSGSGVEPLSFQWQHNGVAIPGATNDTLTLTNVQTQNAGTYHVIVSSPTGATLSEAALLSLVGLVMRPTISIAGAVGTTYRIDYRGDVNATNWTTLTNIILTVTPHHHVDFTAEGQPRRFYRVVPQ